jgi:hypothetical protein
MKEVVNARSACHRAALDAGPGAVASRPTGVWPIVDVSMEPPDGDPTHSGDSCYVKSRLATASTISST